MSFNTLVKILLISLLVILSFSSVLFAQGDFRRGYIVKNNRDTIRGLIDNRTNHSNQMICLFKADSRSKVVRYSPSEIQAYALQDDRYFIAREFQIDSMRMELGFAEVLVYGAAKLMLYRNVYYLELDKLYQLPRRNKDRVVSSDSGVWKKKDLRYVYLINYLFKDCGLNADQLNYQQQDLINIVTEYNRCKGNSIHLPRQTPPLKFSLTLVGGLNKSTLHLSESGYEGSESNTAATFGGGFDLSFPRISRHVSLSVEFFFKNEEYQPYQKPTIEYYYYMYTTQYDNLVRTSILKIPMGVCYNFFPGNNTPYVKIGIVQYHFRKSSSQQIAERQGENNEVNTYFTAEETSGKSELGAWMSFGYNYKVMNKLRIFAEIRLEKLNGEYATFDSASSFNLNALTGIRFTL